MRPTVPCVGVGGALNRPGLAAIRDIGRGGMRVVGLDRRSAPFGLHSRWSEAYGVLPGPWSVAAFCDLLRERRIDVVLPMTSWLVRRLAGERERIEQVAALNLPDLASFEAADDNGRTCTLCAELGIPAARLLSSDEIRLPVIVKPRLDIGGNQGVTLCRREEDLAGAVERCRDAGGALVQDYIPGYGDRMRTVVLLFDRDSRLVAHFTTRKLWTRPYEGGLCTMGISTDEPELVRQVLPFFETLRWRGPAEAELKIDPRDGVAKVIEINPRFPGYIGHAVDCGLHLPRLAVDVALGRRIQPGPYRVGRKYVNAMLHARTILDRLRRSPHRAATIRQALRDGWDAPWLQFRGSLDPAGTLAKVLADVTDRRGGRPVRLDMTP